jgi:membrane protein YqaA with SNARE-associated domain
LKSLAKFFVRYKAWILGLLAGVSGIWAVFLASFIDAAIFGVPIDPIIGYYVAIDPRRTIVYAVMAAAGSAIGSTVPYLIGYYGGETLVAKRIGPERFARMHALSEKYGDLALIIPTMMPPGFPLKAFELMAGVTEMRYLHFTLSIFVGRLLRFLILGWLIIAYGPETLRFLAESLKHHRVAFFAVLALLVAAILIAVKLGSRKKQQPEEQAEVV